MNPLDELCKAPVRRIFAAKGNRRGQDFIAEYGETRQFHGEEFVDAASYDRLRKALEKCRAQRDEWAAAENNPLARNLIELNLKSQDEALAAILQAEVGT